MSKIVEFPTNRRATIDRRLDTRRRDDINALVQSMAANLELLKEVKRLKERLKKYED